MTATQDKQFKKLTLVKPDPTSGLTTVLSDFKKSILENHNAITQCIGQLGVLHIETGNWLRTAKNIVPHGQFEDWFEEQFGESITLRTGQRYMKASRTAEEKMPELRERLLMLRSDLDVASLKDDEVIRELPSSQLFEIVSVNDESPKKLKSKSAIPPATPSINPQLLQVMVDFIGPPMLILTTPNLTADRIQAPEIVTCKDPIGDRTTWPSTALVLANSESICKSLHRLRVAFEAKELRECLLFLPTHMADDVSLHKCPQLIFTPIKPLNGKRARSKSMTLLLLSESDRIPDFASSFEQFGVVKVPYVFPD